MEYLRDYDCTIKYQPGKGNVVADALSRKTPGTLAHLMITEWKLLEEFQDQNLQIVRQSPKSMVVSLVIQPTILQKIDKAQKKDYRLMRIIEDEEKRTKVGLRVANDGLIKLEERVCVPRDMELDRHKICDNPNPNIPNEVLMSLSP